MMHYKVKPEGSPSDESERIDFLKEVQLTQISHGKVSGKPISAESLWKNGPTAIFIARRPGCPVCRMDAKQLSDLFQKQFQHVNLVCIIKEFIPDKVTNSFTDAEVLQSKYFNNLPVYLDTDRKFYEYFGNKSVFWQPYSHTPCGLYSDFSKLVHRIDEAGILDYNLTIGEAWIKGGFLLIGPNEGIVYQHAEMTGSELPLEDIEQAVWNLIVKYPVPQHHKSVGTFVSQFTSPKSGLDVECVSQNVKK